MTLQTTTGQTQMAHEIAEQPAAVARTIEALLPQRSAVAELLRGPGGKPRHVMFAARGTSDNAAVYGRYLLEGYAGITAALAAPSVATHYSATLKDRGLGGHPDLSSVLMVSLSQSGATAEIVQTQRWAKEHGAATLAVTNHSESELAAEADLALVTQAGQEFAVPATKSYTTQLVAMAVLGVAGCDVVGSSQAEALAQQLPGVPQLMSELLEQAAGVDAGVSALSECEGIVSVGRGLLLGTALEAGLKIEETCLRPVRGYSYADMRHGPVAAVNQKTAAILTAAADGPLREPLRELAVDLRERGATVIGIGGDEDFAAACEVHIPAGNLTEPLAPLTSILPAQLLVEKFSRSLGFDPDAPQGLSKVTQTDR